MPSTHTTQTPAPTNPVAGTTGQRVTLAHYTTSHEDRVLVGQRVNGIVRITDEPAGPDGVLYLVEPQLESKAALDALITDYVTKAQRLDYPPMHGWF